MHLIYKLPTMTSNEILKADVLDILFENRNKQYGAYALRKYYNNRLGIALAISLTTVVLVALLIGQSSLNGKGLETDIEECPVLITPVELIHPPMEPEAATPPPAAKVKPIASQAYLSRIEIVADVDPGDMVPDRTDLVDRQIASFTQEGGVPTVNHTIEQPPVEQGPGLAGSTPAESEEGFKAVERLPEFPGGVSAWSAFLSRYLRVPDELPAGERRTVQVRFWVGEDGSVTRFEVAQSAGTAFDNEVIRVLKKMPKWKPAIQNGHPVAVTFTQPVTFQAVEE